MIKSPTLRKLFTITGCFAVLMLTSAETFATHIIGGQITYRQLGDRAVEYTFIGYRDQAGVLFGQGLFDFGDGTFFGDDEDEAFDWQFVSLGNGVERWEFKLIHTYDGFSGYTVSYSEDFRTAEVSNFSGSEATPFYIDAFVALDPFFTNSSPTPLFPPGFIAYTGNKFVTSFSMKDDEGDSLRYSLVIPRQEEASSVPDYLFPSEAEFYSGEDAGRIEIDRISGDLVWTNPGNPGEYLITVRIEEWREINNIKVLVGYTTLDYLIEVKNENPPVSWTTSEITCQGSNEDYEGQVVIENNSNNPLGIRVDTDIDGIMFNGLTVEEWNEEFAGFHETEQMVLIDVTVNAQSLSALTGFNSVNMEITSEEGSLISRFPVALTFGVDCSVEDVVLGENLQMEDEFIRIRPDGILIFNPDSEIQWVTIYDHSGKQLLDQPLDPTKKETIVNYSFQKESIYIIVLKGTNSVSTRKFTLTN